MERSKEDYQYLLKALDDISELIYISDFETYDVLYINNAGMKQFNITEIEQGVKCYKILQGLDAPCPFCTNRLLIEGEDYIWNHINSVTNRYYMLKDRLLWWNGRKARLEIAVDMTSVQNEKLALQYALDSEKMILECVRILTEEKDITKSIGIVLHMVGEYLSADRSYIFEIKDNKMYNTYEWCTDGVISQKDHLQNLDISIIDSWKGEFDKHRCVVIDNIETVADQKLYEILYPQGISSLVIAPLEQNGVMNGYFGVDNPPVEKIRNIAALLDTLRYFIIMTIQKKSDEQLLEKLSLHDTLTGLYNRNKYILDLNILSRQNISLGVLYLDVNGLKEINDQYGHAYGDFVLSKCTEKMKYVFGTASIYRTGGDEFIIICQLDDEAALLQLSKKLKEKFDEDRLCSVAIGYRWAEKSCQLEKIIAEADDFMYEDKKRFYEVNKIQEVKRLRCTRNYGCSAK